MASIREASERYKEDVPIRCFTSKVPFVMQVAQDNTILPSQNINLLSPGGTRSKWIRVARYQDFVNACGVYLASTSGVVLHDQLNVFIMPYMPVEDAFLLHELVMNPAPMPNSYTDAVQMLQNQIQGPFVAPMVGIEQEEKRGVLAIPEFDLNMEFVVSNYHVLWSKSKTKCMLDFLSDPMVQFVELADICDEIFANEDSDESDQVDASLEDAKRQLIFSLHQTDASDADLHHVILSMYPAVHASVYEECQHCDVMRQFDDIVNCPETGARLQSSLVFLGYQHDHDYGSVEDNECKLMMIEGHLEYLNFKAKLKHEFTTAREVMKNSLAPLIDQIVLATQELSLMGVTT